MDLDKKKRKIEFMKGIKISAARESKRLLISCMIGVAIAWATALLPVSHAFAATNLHASTVPATKSMISHSFTDFLYPSYNFSGTNCDNLNG